MKKRLLPILTALTLLLTVAVMTSVVSATSTSTYVINYVDSIGVCNVTWTDYSDVYIVDVYKTSNLEEAIYSSGYLTESFLLVRQFAEDGCEYYVEVYNFTGTEITLDITFTYDASKEVYDPIIYSANYDTASQTLSWSSSGTIAGFKVDVCESGSTEVIYSVYTTDNSIEASEIFPANGKYWFKIWIVDSDGNKINESSNAWVCVTTAAYEYTDAPVTVTFDANGGFFNDDNDYSKAYVQVDSDGKVTFPTNQYKVSHKLEGWYTAAEGGDEVDENTLFTSDTTVYAQWVICDHVGGGSSSCWIHARCSICGGIVPLADHNLVHYDATDATCTEDGNYEYWQCSECGAYCSDSVGENSTTADAVTISATGHSYNENNKCTYCGTIGASDSESSTDTSSGTVKSVLSITATDSSTNSALAGVVNSSSVTSSTVTMSRTTQPLTGTLSVGQVADSSAPGVISVTDSLGTLNLGNATTSGANITAGTVLSGTYTDTSSGDVTPMAGEVLFYGDISYSDESVIEKSTFSISLTPTNGGTLDVSTLSVLHYDTSTSTWGALEITGTSTDQTTGQVTVNFQTSSLSPVMVLTAGSNYGTVTVGGVTLSSGEYTTDGSTKTVGTPTGSGYAYFNKGVLYLNNFTYTTSNTIATDYATISTTSSELTISLYGDNTIGGENYGICNRNGDVNIVLTDITVPGSLALQPSTTGSYSRGIYCVGAVTIDGVSLTVSANDHSICSMSSSITIKNGAVLEADCTLSATGDITIENSTVAITTTSTDGAISAENLSITASDVTADGGISVSHYDFEEEITVYDTITLTPGTGKTLEVMLGKGATPISYSEATSIIGSAWNGYSYISIIQADAGGTSHTHSYISEVTTAATCTENGMMTYTCSCGDTYTEEIQATGHSYEAVVTAPTCTEGGYTTYTCTTCGASYTADETEATGHKIAGDNVSFDWDYMDSSTNKVPIRIRCPLCREIIRYDLADLTSEYTNPTCTTEGFTTYEATYYYDITGETYTGTCTIPDYGSATWHTWDEGVVTKSATCGTAGETTYTCEVCGETYTETIKATGNHNYYAIFSWDTDDYSSCSVNFVCTDCNDMQTTDATVTPVTTPATCGEAGKTAYTATVEFNGTKYTDKQTVTIPATGHTTEIQNAKSATCTEDGYTGDEVCTVCGETITAGETIPATGHNYEAVITAPTCTEGGYTTYTCTTCGASYTADETEATGHSYTELYVWSSDFSFCTVTLTCDTCSELVEYVSTTDDEVTITEVDGLFTVTLIHDGMTYSTSVQTYTVTWVDGDGKEVQVDSRLLEGATVSYSGSTPTKASDNTYSYTFAGWDKTIEAVSGNTTYTATFTASAHNYTASFAWADDLKSATVTLTCSDCDHTVTIDSSDVTIKAVNNLGLVTRTATAEFNGVTYADSVTTGTSLLVIQADYSAVTLAISRANGLDASSYSNFETVTAAIDAVQWGLNVLNQPVVTAYADAINEAIDSLVLADFVEETVEINEPIEGTDTVTEPDDEPEEVEANDPEPEANPTTGIMISLMAIATAAAATVASKRR